jgi:hypothetical protein
MKAHNKEVVYVIRSPQGMITDVFDPKTNQYLKVVDTAITIDSSEPEDIEESIKAYARRKGGG